VSHESSNFAEPVIQFSDQPEQIAITDDLLLAICEAADVIACECPGYLTRLLRQVRAFRHYTEDCTQTFPEAAQTHEWLSQQAQQVEALLFQTMLELMRREQLIDASNQLSLDKLSARARAIMLKQIGEGTD
jgi:hypothetical protein